MATSYVSPMMSPKMEMLIGQSVGTPAMLSMRREAMAMEYAYVQERFRRREVRPLMRTQYRRVDEKQYAPQRFMDSFIVGKQMSGLYEKVTQYRQASGRTVF